jgi:hypothetical protein
MPEHTSVSPSMPSPCMAPRILPRSDVGVTSTRGFLPASVRMPTVFSGLSLAL